MEGGLMPAMLSARAPGDRDARLIGEDDGLHAVAQTELHEDSRAVSSSRPRGGSVGVGAALANSWIRRLVIDGASSASPSATTRMPATSCSGGTSLSRKPLAPARSAS